MSLISLKRFEVTGSFFSNLLVHIWYLKISITSWKALFSLSFVLNITYSASAPTATSTGATSSNESNNTSSISTPICFYIFTNQNDGLPTVAAVQIVKSHFLYSSLHLSNAWLNINGMTSSFSYWNISPSYPHFNKKINQSITSILSFKYSRIHKYFAEI